GRKPRALERRTTRRDRLGEDPRARARAGGRDRQLDRPRPHRHGSDRRGLSGRADRGRPGRDPAAPSRDAPGGGGRRLLPRLRPGRLRDRNGPVRRRRAHAQPVVKRLTPARLAAAGLLLLAVVALVLWLAPSDSYIFLPDRAHAVAPLVAVPGGKTLRDGGGIYYVDVFVRKASWLERLFPSVREGATIVPASVVQPPGVSQKVQHTEDLRAM